MSSTSERPRSYVRDLLLIFLAFSSGTVDAISFLGLGRVFTANMTGNIVLLGLATGRSAGAEAVRAAVSLVAFIAGVLVATWLARRSRISRRAGVTVGLWLEAAAQGGFLIGWLLTHGHPNGSAEAVLVGTSGVAMGLQSGAVVALGIAGISTTYVTGTLTGLLTELVTGGGQRREWLRRGSVLLALLAGAACSGALLIGARRTTPALPLALTLLVATGATLLIPHQPQAEGR